MGKLMEHSDSCSDYKYDQSYVSMSPTLTPTSPLDLSRHSKRFPFNPTSTSPLDLSVRPGSIFARQMSVDPVYEGPMIVVQPKSEWHYRSLKDLANNHLPLLAGNGRQRTPIRVSVPETCNISLYLTISILTTRDARHPSKVIVPAGTRVNSTLLSHDNNLDCLQFDENSTDHVRVDQGRIYSRISPDEHRARAKDVRIHMFNLYQNQAITKELIETEELHRCKLSFQFCSLQDGQYIPVSRPSFSDIIEEKKMTSRSRPYDQSSTSSVSPTSYSRSPEGYSNQNDRDSN